MTTLVPRQPYSPEELAKLYPQELALQQVQIILRHGERTPVSARFKNAGLPAYWPYCKVASSMKSAVMSADGSWDTLAWTRRLEVFERQLDSSASDSPASPQGSKGEIDNICQPGELTDRGRETTLALGRRLRDLYVTKLGFLSSTLDTASSVYLRATPIPRALESTQQTFTGLYPASSRAAGLPPPTIVQRSMADETLFPNEGGCKRFGELAAAFANRTAEIWNPSPELAYINKRIGKHMPPESPIVKVDSHPRLSGVMDTINATLAHGSGTKLPSEFYDPQLITNVDRVCTEEWFAGYTESQEYRKLGIGAMVGDVVEKMVKKAQSPADETFKISLSGCHDTTLAATIASLGAYDVTKDKWPPYTSSIALELFKTRSANSSSPPASPVSLPRIQGTWWSSLFSSSPSVSPSSSTRKLAAEMSPSELSSLENHFIRVRYNDRPLVLPYCARPGNHFEGDEGLCTLKAFKEVVDEFTPRNWKRECRTNLGAPAIKGEVERPMGL